MCVPMLPYAAVLLRVAVRPRERRCRSGLAAVDGSAPSRDASIGIGECGHVHAHATHPGGLAPDPWTYGLHPAVTKIVS